VTPFNIDWEKYRLIDLSYEVVPGASRDRYFDIERGLLADRADSGSPSGAKAKPSLTPDAAQWFADHKVKMVGIDTHFGLGRNVEEGRALHDIFMGSGGTLVEFLDNLDQIRRPEFYFMALPYKARTVDSSWARAIAIEER